MILSIISILHTGATSFITSLGVSVFSSCSTVCINWPFKRICLTCISYGMSWTAYTWDKKKVASLHRLKTCDLNKHAFKKRKHLELVSFVSFLQIDVILMVLKIYAKKRRTLSSWPLKQNDWQVLGLNLLENKWSHGLNGFVSGCSKNYEDTNHREWKKFGSTSFYYHECFQ